MRTESTPGARGPVFCGVDTHADSHWLCVLDWRGRKVLSRQFPADAAGYEALSPARTQRRRPGQGKCDEADAERAARAAMSGSKLGRRRTGR